MYIDRCLHHNMQKTPKDFNIPNLFHDQIMKFVHLNDYDDDDRSTRPMTSKFIHK